MCAFVARRRHAEQVSALAGLQLTSIVGVRPTQLAAKRLLHLDWAAEATVKKTVAFRRFPSVFLADRMKNGACVPTSVPKPVSPTRAVLNGPIRSCCRHLASRTAV